MQIGHVLLLYNHLSFDFSLGYSENHPTQPPGPVAKSYRAQPSLVYVINRTVSVSLSYSFLSTTTEGAGRVNENAIEFTIGKRF